MILNNNYYTIAESSGNGNEAVYSIKLLRDCTVYQGHFPGKPVCPGVLNVQTVKECVERTVGKVLRIVSVRQCRFLAVATPYKCPSLTVTISYVGNSDGDSYDITASISGADTVYMTFRGVMAV